MKQGIRGWVKKVYIHFNFTEKFLKKSHLRTDNELEKMSFTVKPINQWYD
jgi:hypothetical protein